MTYKDSLDTAILKVLESGNYILGEQLSAFEKEFAQYLGVKHCVGVASGTEAIALSLQALGVGKGNEVITTAVTAYPTIAGIAQAQAIPVVVDINPADGLIDHALIESKVTPKTKAIMPVHLYGQCCDMKAIRTIASRHDLWIVEDAAHAAGAAYQGKKAGSWGHCNAFSFYPTKNLGAFGDGGAVATDSEDLYDRLLAARNYGQTNRYHHDTQGINSRLDEIQAAILRVKLRHLDEWNRRRNAIAAAYREHLKTVRCLDHHAYGEHAYHLFVVQHRRRDACLQYLRSKGIQTLIHYPVPVHKQKAFVYQNEGSLLMSERFVDTIFSLPLYPGLKDENVNQIIEVVNEFPES